MKIFSQEITNKKIIDEAHHLELCQNYDLLRKTLSPVWRDLDDDPYLEDVPEEEKAEILLVCGRLLLKFGRSKNLKNFIERGRDYLTVASELFGKLDNENKSVEAKVAIADAYHLEGRDDEFLIYLDESEESYKGKSMDPVRMLMVVYRLVYFNRKNKLSEAYDLVTENTVFAEVCPDKKVTCQFYNEVGLLYRKLEKYKDALFYYELSLNLAKELNNDRYIASKLNNMAFLYKIIGEFDLAIEHVDLSYKLYKELKDTGWLLHVEDTKAQILFAKGDFKEALDLIRQTIFWFRQGDDYHGLAEAIFLRTLCFAELRKYESFRDSAEELIKISKEHLGEFASKQYQKKLLSSYTSLYFTKFPADAITLVEFNQTVDLSNLGVEEPRNIEFFVLPKRLVKNYPLEIHSKDVLLITEFECYAERGDLILFKDSSIYRIGELMELNDKWTIEDCNINQHKIYKIGEIDCLRKILGYCYYQDANKTIVKFKPLQDL